MGQRDRGLGKNTLRWGKIGWGNGDTSSWGVDFTQELQDSTEEPRNRQWGSWGHPHGCSCVCERERSEKNGEGVSSVQGV
jgi:hypothetical protein